MKGLIRFKDSLYAEVFREYIFAKRYFVEVLVRLFTVYAFFLVLFLISKGLGKYSSMAYLNVLDLSAYQIIGFAMWLFALLAVGVVSDDVVYGSTMGVLESIWLMPNSPLMMICIRALAKAIFELIFLSLFLTVGIISTGITLHPSILPAIFLLMLTLAGLFGLGLFFGGISLVYKRIGPVSSIVRTAFLFLTGALVPLSALPNTMQIGAHFLPMTDGLILIRKLLVDGNSSAHILMHTSFCWLILNSSIYLLIGILTFQYFEKKARDQGLLGVY